MNILYINHYAGSLYHGMEYRPYYLAREWVKLGHNVSIIASSYSHLRSQNIKLRWWQNIKNENIDGINYIWCKTPKYHGNGFRRVINIFVFLSRLDKLIPRILLLQKPDLVIASSTYPFDTKVAFKIAKKARAKMIYEVHDLWPLTPIELGGMSKWHPYIWSMQQAENFGYRKADKVVSLLPKAFTHMQQHGMRPNKFVYIPNGVAIDDWQLNKEILEEPYLQAIDQLRNKYKFLVGYAGGMGESNALNFFIDAALKCPDIGVVLVGDGVDKNKLMIQAGIIANVNTVCALNNIVFLPRIRKNQIPDFLARMDALYIGWHKLSIYRFGVCPNKLFDYMLAAKPIIHSVSAGNDLVAEAHCGISVVAEDVGAIVMAMHQMRGSEAAKLAKWGENAYNYVVNNHDYKLLSREFLAKVCEK